MNAHKPNLSVFRGAETRSNPFPALGNPTPHPTSVCIGVYLRFHTSIHVQLRSLGGIEIPCKTQKAFFYNQLTQKKINEPPKHPSEADNYVAAVEAFVRRQAQPDLVLDSSCRTHLRQYSRILITLHQIRPFVFREPGMSKFENYRRPLNTAASRIDPAFQNKAQILSASLGSGWPDLARLVSMAGCADLMHDCWWVFFVDPVIQACISTNEVRKSVLDRAEALRYKESVYAGPGPHEKAYRMLVDFFLKALRMQMYGSFRMPGCNVLTPGYFPIGGLLDKRRMRMRAVERQGAAMAPVAVKPENNVVFGSQFMTVRIGEAPEVRVAQRSHALLRLCVKRLYSLLEEGGERDIPVTHLIKDCMPNRKMKKGSKCKTKAMLQDMAGPNSKLKGALDTLIEVTRSGVDVGDQYNVDYVRLASGYHYTVSPLDTVAAVETQVTANPDELHPDHDPVKGGQADQGDVTPSRHLPPKKPKRQTSSKKSSSKLPTSSVRSRG